MRGVRASKFCVETNRLPPADVISVGKQLAGALAALHARGILHRDLHGGNVLIDLGREATATLIDVGMVECTDVFYAAVDQRYPTPPEHRKKLGTGGLEQLEWTAPEARATRVWTAKCDVYSLGLLLYKMLTGKRPTRGKTRELVSPRQYVPACPTALASALLGALHDDPAPRVDVASLLAKLDAASDEMSDDEEAPEARISVPGPRRRRMRRPPRCRPLPRLAPARGSSSRWRPRSVSRRSRSHGGVRAPSHPRRTPRSRPRWSPRPSGAPSLRYPPRQ